MKKPYTPEFEKFWERYPRKLATSKVKAFASWERALKYATAKAIMAGLERYPFSTEPQFQPHAATWINQHRWEGADHSDTAPPTAARPPSRASWRDKYDGHEVPFQSFPEQRESRLAADDLFTIDVDPRELHR